MLPQLYLLPRMLAQLGVAGGTGLVNMFEEPPVCERPLGTVKKAGIGKDWKPNLDIREIHKHTAITAVI